MCFSAAIIELSFDYAQFNGYNVLAQTLESKRWVPP